MDNDLFKIVSYSASYMIIIGIIFFIAWIAYGLYKMCV